MFDQLFERSHALTRQRSAPLADERRRYISHCMAQGMAKRTLRLMAELLLAVEDRLRVGDRPNSLISRQEVEDAGESWSKRQAVPPIRVSPKLSKQRFIRHAIRWLSFMERLQPIRKIAKPYDGKIAAFADFMLQERGLSVMTVEQRCHSAREFLERLCNQGIPLDSVTIAHIDSILGARVREGKFTRATVQTYASSLRAFFRFAETRGWCNAGVAASIMAPRVFRQESLPSGPSWSDVQKLLGSTHGDSSSAIRDRAILMVLAVYGVRAGEVAHLRLEDIDWERDLIAFTRSKRLGSHRFPLVQEVGEAIARYLRLARPASPHRAVFLTVRAPFRPLTAGTLWPIVGRRLRAMGTSIKHHGPHALRHACATHLINEGLSLKEVGDHLGHRSLETTRIYAKVDLTRLREVASFDLGGLL
jgi:site-specific recombinase XerD